MQVSTVSNDILETPTRLYQTAVETLNAENAPYLVGGAHALSHYTGFKRHTKDFDIFVRPQDVSNVLNTLGRAGYKTEITFPHWLAKVYHESDFIDVIFCSGNGVAIVDDGWFEHSVKGEIFGMTLNLCPAEEMIWSKAFVVERERYDGADIAHLLRARGHMLDWPRILHRFGRNWRVLLSHLVLFGYIYPGERTAIPEWVMHELLERTQRELSGAAPVERVCQGTLLSRAQYLVDISSWGYEDARLRDDVHMTADDIAIWTHAIEGTSTVNGNHHEHNQDKGNPGSHR